MTRQMEELLGCRKSNKFFGEGDSIVGKLLFWRYGKENVMMDHESGKVGDAKCEVFQFKHEDWDLVLCVMRNK